MSIQISGGGPGVAEIQSGLATAAAVAALATSVAGREQAVSVNAPSHISVAANMTSSTWNTIGTHEVFTVTGAVRLKTWVLVAGLGTGSGEPYAMLTYMTEEMTPIFPTCVMEFIMQPNAAFFTVGGVASTNPADLDDWCREIVLVGLDIGLEINGEPLTSGTMTFHCVWEPLSAGATVVAGAGGPL